MKRLIAFLAFAAILAPEQAFATRTVTSPYIDQGVLKLKLKGGVTKDDEKESRDGAWATKLGGEYGVTDRLALEGEANIENAGDDDNTDVTSFDVKAKVLFTEKGKYWLDAGTRVTYTTNLTDGADSMEVKILLAKDMDKFRHVANIIFDREVGAKAEGGTNGGFSWSSRYKWTKEFQPGFEMYNNFGDLSNRPDFQDQDYSIGPMAYGNIGDHLRYEAGYLFGVTENAADGRLKGVLEYSLKF